MNRNNTSWQNELRNLLKVLGGFQEVGFVKEKPWQECAKRKGKEELGIDLPIGNLISVENYFADDADWHTVNLVVHAFFSHRLIELIIPMKNLDG